MGRSLVASMVRTTCHSNSKSSNAVPAAPGMGGTAVRKLTPVKVPAGGNGAHSDGGGVRQTWFEASVNSEFTIISGTANPALAKTVAGQLGTEVSACVVDRYPDGDVAVRLLASVRRKEVFLVQPTSPPVNEHLIELLALADACRRAGAARITAIVPFFGYGRADKRHGRREPIMARVVADLLQIVGISHVVTLDLHTPQIEGFFHAPVDSLTAVPTLCQALRERVPADLVVVSPDVGRMGMATRYAEQCVGSSVVVLPKRRMNGSETKVTHVVGRCRAEHAWWSTT
jgi:ribose-phosphate pyrophosphokinase